jgi:cation:H+ antiporter
VILEILALVGGLVLLYVGAEALVKGAVALGQRVGVSPIVVGLTVVSIGTSAPELVVCVMAALQGSPELAVGNVLGSNMANVGLILGLAALVRPLRVRRRIVRREIPWMLAVTILVFPVLWNLRLGRIEGTVLALLLLVYLVLLIPKARAETAEVLGEVGDRLERQVPKLSETGYRILVRPLFLVVVGSLALVGGGQGIVHGATAVAMEFGVPQLVVGLSILAVGTSLPELAATLVAAARRETDLAVGNIVGSNIFNLTFVLGGTALVRPIEIPQRVLWVEYPAAFGISLLLLPLALWAGTLGRKEGVLLLAAYAAGWVYILSVR